MLEERKAQINRAKTGSLRLPLVSILVPSYNSKAFLNDCLESALGQTYPRVETVVVDDGSNDGSLELACGFRSRGVRVIVQENRGQPSALNAAFGAANGEVFQYLDSDDVLHPRKIEVQMSRLLCADPMAMASGAWARFRSSLSSSVFEPEGVWQDLSPVDWLVQSWSGGGMMHVAGWLIPRRVVEAAGPWVDSLRWAANVDADFFTRTLLASTRCLFCSEARSYYRTVPGSQSSLKSRKNLEASLSVLIRIGEALLLRENSVRTREAFADQLQRFVYSAYPDSRDLVSLAETRIRELGGSQLSYAGGTVTLGVAKWLGWKPAGRFRQVADAVRRAVRVAK
jgi:glycosyltransferase involved in cell wall biosynthesis